MWGITGSRVGKRKQAGSSSRIRRAVSDAVKKWHLDFKRKN